MWPTLTSIQILLCDLVSKAYFLERGRLLSVLTNFEWLKELKHTRQWLVLFSKTEAARGRGEEPCVLFPSRCCVLTPSSSHFPEKNCSKLLVESKRFFFLRWLWLEQHFPCNLNLRPKYCLHLNKTVYSRVAWDLWDDHYTVMFGNVYLRRN